MTDQINGGLSFWKKETLAGLKSNLTSLKTWDLKLDQSGGCRGSGDSMTQASFCIARSQVSSIDNLHDAALHLQVSNYLYRAPSFFLYGSFSGFFR